MKREMTDYMSKGVKIKMGKPTETFDLSLWELMDSGRRAREPAYDLPRPSTSG